MSPRSPSPSGMQPDGPLLRTSSEHIPVVRALRARSRGGCLPLLFHCPFHFSARFTCFYGFPAVMLLLAFGQPEFNLRKTSFGEINAERNEREPLLLRLAEEFIDLLAMEEQFPRTERLMIHDVAVAIGTDVAMVKKRLAALYAGVTVLEIHPSLSKGFHLRTLEHNACLELLLNEIVVVGLAICGYCLFEAIFLFPHTDVRLSLPGRSLLAFPPEYAAGG